MHRTVLKFDKVSKMAYCIVTRSFFGGKIMLNLLIEVRRALGGNDLSPTQVSERLKIAINSLFSEQPNLLILTNKEACELIKKHPGVAAILKENSPEKIAWAIKLAAERRARSS